MSGTERSMVNSAGTGNLSALSFAILMLLLYRILSERGTPQVCSVFQFLPPKVYLWCKKQSIQLLPSSNHCISSQQSLEQHEERKFTWNIFLSMPFSKFEKIIGIAHILNFPTFFSQ